MTKNENEFLDNVLLEVVQHKDKEVVDKLKISNEKIEKFYERIPGLLENVPYTENITELVNNIVQEENKKLLMELNEYLDEVVKNRKNPLIPIWIAMFVVFALQLFLLFS
ncbi:MAG: hypothetical protein LBL65_05975 [Campylobacteraceae bacterium]|jgi:Fe2+ transport system protein B|nr:hypothetical protein [Campylobacteraceae bacterium]